MTITIQRASVTAKGVLDSVGVNTHIDFGSAGYNNLTVTVGAINFLGIKHIRDCPGQDADVSGPRAWSVVASGASCKFLPFIGETGPANAQVQLDRYSKLAAQGILEGAEGPNEWDAAFAIQSGGSLALAAAFQPKVFAEGQRLNLPVVNISFGAGWTAANNWQGNYASQGDLSATCDFGNAHTYPQPGQTIGGSIDRLNGLAKLAASSRPILTTEFGFPENQFPNKQDNARFCLFGIVSGLKLGNPRTYFYALFDDVAGKFGIMNSDGSPKPAGQAIANFLSILKDTGPDIQLGSLAYEVAGDAADQSLLVQKSDGTFKLLLWNETSPAHNVVVNLGAAANNVRIYDPIRGTSPISSLQQASSITVNLTNYPIIVDIDTVGAIIPIPPVVPPVAPPVVPPVVPPTTPATGWNIPFVCRAGQTIALPLISFTDDWALNHPGQLALNISVTFGMLNITDSTGALVGGSGTGKIKLSANLNSLNDFLSRMTYVATKTGTAVLTLDMWNQGGTQKVATVNITVQ